MQGNHLNKKQFLLTKSWILILISILILFEGVLFFKNYIIANANYVNMANSQQNYDPDPYYGTKEYWNEKFGPHDNLYLSPNVAPGTILYEGTYFVGQDITINSTDASTPGLSISGNVNLYFENGSALKINLANSSNGVGSAPGIRLPQFATLNCIGKGVIEINGSSVVADSAFLSGGNAIPNRAGYAGDRYGGYGGIGGSGSGGVAALIGTDGGSGGAGGSCNKKELLVNTHGSFGWEQGPDGGNGSDGSSSQNCGNIVISGNIITKFSPGKIIKTGGSVSVGKESQHWSSASSWWESWYLGGNGGGGQGAYGFLGAIIGSGGSGGGGGGAGGAGGIDYTKWNNYNYPCAGGGGAGAGSEIAYGGKGKDMGDHQDYDHNAKDGGNSSIGSTSVSPGDGGKGAYGGSSADTRGGNGGNGGDAKDAGTPGVCYVLPSILDLVNNNSSNLNEEGQESTRLLVYPQDDCELRLFGSISDERYVYSYKGEKVVPDFEVVHKPTGKVIPSDCYDVEWIDNDKPGYAKLLIKGKSELRSDVATIGETPSSASGELSADFVIVNSFKVSGLKLETHEKTYDGNVIKWIVNNPQVLDEEDKPIQGVQYSDVSFTYYKENSETGEYEIIDSTPINVGKYYAVLLISKTGYEWYRCLGDYYFEINKSNITIDQEESEGYTVCKQYDNTKTVDAESHLEGSLSFKGIIDADIEKLEITPVLTDFEKETVYNKIVNCTLEIKNKTGDDVIQNYNLVSDSTDIAYSIIPREISVVSASALPRAYKAGDYSVDIKNVEFSNLLSGKSFARDVDWSCIGRLCEGQGCDPGEHDCECEIKINNENYTFEDGPTFVYSGLKVYFAKGFIGRPSPSSITYYYNGEIQHYDVDAIEGLYTVANNDQKEPGTYQVTYTLCSGILWEGVPSGEETKPYIINWEIKKHSSLDFNEEPITQVASDHSQINYNLKLSEMPEDMNVSNMTLSVVEGSSYVQSSSFDIDTRCLSYKLSNNAVSDQDIKFNIKIESGHYEDTNLIVIVSLIEKYNVTISGYEVKSKVYDGQASLISGEPHVEVTDPNVLVSDVTDEVKDSIKFKYYQRNGTEWISLDEAPKDAGDYRCFAILDSSDTFVSGYSEEMPFSIEQAEAIKFEDVEESRCYGIKDMNYVGQLNFNPIPSGQVFQPSISSIDDKNILIDNNQIEVNNEGKISIKLNKDSMGPDKVLIVKFAIIFKNYKTSYINYTLTLDDKTNLDIGGISLEDKVYDGNYLNYTGTFHIKDGDTDLTEELKDFVEIIYTDAISGVTYSQPQTKAGFYKIQIIIPIENELYRGKSEIYEAAISRKPLTTEEEITIEKAYDSTTALPADFVDDIELDETEILESDKGKVSAKVLADAFPSANVGEYQNFSKYLLEGDAASNYCLANERIITNYKITPKTITVNENSASVINRAYDSNNDYFDVNVSLNGVITGFEPTYKAISNSLESNNVASNIPVNSYEVTLLADARSNDDNSSICNYAFEVAGEPSNSITVDCDLEGNIFKADLPVPFIEDNVTFNKEIGFKTFNFDKSLFPGGMLDEDTAYFKDELVDENNIIADWSVDQNTGQISFELTDPNSIDANAILCMKVKSHNYNDSIAKLNVSLTHNNEGEGNTSVSQTGDSSILYVFSFIFIFSLLLLLGFNLKRN